VDHESRIIDFVTTVFGALKGDWAGALIRLTNSTAPTADEYKLSFFIVTSTSKEMRLPHHCAKGSRCGTKLLTVLWQFLREGCGALRVRWANPNRNVFFPKGRKFGSAIDKIG
jgi:hypothetical protein